MRNNNKVYKTEISGTENLHLIAGSTLYFHSASTNLTTRALTITTTEPRASPSTCKNTPRMFSCAPDSVNIAVVVVVVAATIAIAEVSE